MRFSQGSIIGLSGVILLLVIVVWGTQFISKKNTMLEGGITQLLSPSMRQAKNLRAFTSSEEMKDYMARGESYGVTPFSPMNGGVMSPSTFDEMSPEGSRVGMQKTASKIEASPHFSQTNVQVSGIDEPDIVKTDGKSLFVSQEAFPILYESPQSPVSVGGAERIGLVPQVMPDWMPARGNVRVIETEALGKMTQAGKIENRSGNLLLSKNVLVVLDSTGVFGYDRKDVKNLKKVWSIDLKEGEIVDARMVKNQLYLIERTVFNREKSCPFIPLMQGEREVEILCSDIYHPYFPVPVSAIYTIMRVYPETGLIEKKKSFVGAYDTAMTIFDGGIYTWYSEQEDALDVMYDFFRVNNTLISQQFFLRLEKLREYDISDQSKTEEFFLEIEKYQRGLDADGRLKFQNDLENALSGYLEEHKRELTKTHIFRFNLETLEGEESGYVPGILHNQFSVDEYGGRLRVATTVGGYFGQMGNPPQEENDVYVLDGNLNIEGSVRGMGKDERIYSTRFVGDRGYVVTFKETDPFYVLDLSDPKNPKVSGELKIPGYSSYLHPLENHRVIGIGKEDNKIKVTLFDTSDAENPKELSKNLLNEYWSDVLSTHHAFVVKTETKTFFLPGDQGGYMFSYDEDELKLVKAISEIQTKRAVYIGEIWYILGQDGVVSYSEKQWEKKGDIRFE